MKQLASLLLLTILSCGPRVYPRIEKNDQAYNEYVRAYHNVMVATAHSLAERLYKIPYEVGDEFGLSEELYIPPHIADTTVWIDMDIEGITLPKEQRIQLIDLKDGSYHVKVLHGEHSNNELLFISVEHLTEHLFPENITVKAELLSREMFVRDSLRNVVALKFNLTLEQLDILIQNRR
jgi:hypothetical protein